MSDYTPPITLGTVEIDTTPDHDGDLEIYTPDGDHFAYLTRPDQIALRDLLNKLHPQHDGPALHLLTPYSKEAKCGNVGGVHLTGRGDVTCPACLARMHPAVDAVLALADEADNRRGSSMYCKVTTYELRETITTALKGKP
jgi:hypothetical protein